ncbi:MAG: c-type cytochrome domain-containing protein, partial [Planctomycetota bacterium]
MTELCFRSTIGILLLMLPHVGVAQQRTDFQPDKPGFREVVAPFFQQHCLRCHGPDDQQADFRVDQHLPNDFLDVVAKGKWGEVVNVLNGHEMPPEDEPQPKAEEVARVVDWITQQMVRAELYRRDSAIVVRRMNRAEYRNT